MTSEEKLITLRSEIIYHRRKGESLRKRAAAQDAIANAKVKEAAALGTGTLPLMGESKKTIKLNVNTGPYPPQDW